MVSIATAYFYRVNMQPARDVRTLKSLPVTFVCLQDTEHVINLIDASFGGPKAHSRNVTTIANTGILLGTDTLKFYNCNVLVSKFEVDGQEYTVINAFLAKDALAKRDHESLKQISKEASHKLEQVLSAKGKILFAGNLDILEDSPGFWRKKTPAKIFANSGMNHISADSNYIAWKGMDLSDSYSIESKSLGTDQDWLVANL